MRSDEALHALDRATRAMAGELDVDRVLQLIVEGVRELVGAQYAALGTITPDGLIERFITSGISAEERARIGALPEGHGLLGTIIRDGVSLRIPNIAEHPESYGFPPNHPPMTSLLGVPVKIGGQAVGNLYLTDKLEAAAFSPDDQALVELFALHAGIAIQNARLHREVQKLALVDERLRISHDLHDGIIQSLYAVSLSLEDVGELITSEPDAAVDRVDRSIDRLHTTIGDIRAMIVGLGPEVEAGLAGAIQAMADEMFAGSPVALTVDLSGADAVEARLHPEAGHELIQIAREALSNVARHSGAHAAELSLHVAPEVATLQIHDDGIGFDRSRRLGGGHFGLANLRDRTAGIGGSLEIQTEPGRGTRIIVRLPLAPVESKP